MNANGILNVNKPTGKTSQQVVSLIKRRSGQRHVGHAGTLDPQASGVLPVLLGQATRVSSFITNDPKVYQAELELGVTTDTYDAEGQVTASSDASHVTREQVEAALPAFRGRIKQRPPMYSALKHRGQRLYDLARAGIEVERKEREVRVYRLELIGWQPPHLSIEVECGRGTYIRSLAHDLGQSLGCGAHLSQLVRLRCGPFYISDSLTMPQLEDSFLNGYWQQLLYPMDVALEGIPAAIVDPGQERAILHGRPVAMESAAAGDRCRAYSTDGRFLAVLGILPQSGLWHPQKVFPEEG